MTQHDYMTKTANKIIDEDTGKELNYRQLSNHPKYKNNMETILHKQTRQIIPGGRRKRGRHIHHVLNIKIPGA